MIKQNKKIYKIILAVLGLLIFFNIFGFLKPVNRILGSVVNFFSSKVRQEVNESVVRESREDLLKKIENLEFELAEEKASLSLLNSLQIENEQFRNFFNFFETNNYNYLLADVVWENGLLNFSSTNQNLVINKGEKDGLYPGLAVISESGILIGKIIETEENYSQVCLSNNSFCRLAVSLNNEEKSSGLAEGNLGLSVKINFIPQNENVSVGNIVFSSGLEKDIPKGLYLGEVVNVEKKENDIWQDIVVESFFNSKNLNRVAIIIPE